MSEIFTIALNVIFAAAVATIVVQQLETIRKGPE